MKNFFATLFKWNWANAGKLVVGAAAGVVAASAFAAFPPAIIAASVIIISMGSAVGLHAIHLAEPPEAPIEKKVP